MAVFSYRFSMDVSRMKNYFTCANNKTWGGKTNASYALDFLKRWLVFVGNCTQKK